MPSLYVNLLFYQQSVGLEEEALYIQCGAWWCEQVNELILIQSLLVLMISFQRAIRP